MKNLTGIPIKCKTCGYSWLTKSKMAYVSKIAYVCCPRCQNKNKIPKK